MSEFFRPFRRKLGLLLLAVACPLMGMWVRSFCIRDSYQYRYAMYVDSIEGRVRYVCDVRGALVSATRPPIEYWSVSYSTIVVPLSLVSAALLLSRPRKKA